MARAPHILFVVNEAAFFASHRLAIGRALVARGARVSLLAPEDASFEAIAAAGIECIPWRLRTRGRAPAEELRSLAHAVGTLGRRRPDLVHTVTIKAAMYGGFAARVLGVPLVVALSGLGTAFTGAKPSAQQAVARAAATTAYRALFRGKRVAIIVQNEDDQRVLIEERLAPPARIRRIDGSGVDLDRFAFAPLPDDAVPAVLHPARLLRNKGVADMAAAAVQLRRRGVRARIVLAGGLRPDHPSAIGRDELEGWLRAGDLEWVGELDREAMIEAYRKASLVALASHREGLPLALVEAAATGRAIVTTDVPGCRRTVVDGETGWLVPAEQPTALADAIEAALSDRAELAARGLAGRRYAERLFSVASVIDAHLAIYEEILGSRAFSAG